MILTVDIGNATTVFGGVQGKNVVFEARLRTDTTKTSDQYCVDLKILLEVRGVDPGQIEGAIIASVAPQALNAVQSAVRQLTGQTALVVGPGLKTGLKILLEDPSQTGADQVAAAVAALQDYAPPLILIDMGTATTMTVLDRTGAHIGGSILPGVRVSLDALTERAALLPGLQLDRPKSVIGKNTVDAMRSGIMLGTACMLDGMLERFEAELGCPATVLATGGMARYIVPLCRRPMVYDKDLVLKGLAALYRANRH